MTSPLLFASGLVLLVVVLYDFLHTTISLNGLGPLTRPVMAGLWRIARATTTASEARLGLSLRGLIGPGILVAVAGVWITLHFVGYTLLFRAGPSLQMSETKEAANLVETMAFVGAALSTLGASKVGPANGWWDLLSMVAAVNGMVVLTLGVSFVLGVRQTTVRARAWAMRYNAIAEGEHSHGADGMPDAIAALGTELCDVVVQLTASPLPSVFAPSDWRLSFPRALDAVVERMAAADLAGRDAAVEAGRATELRAALRLLGHQLDPASGQADFDGARNWAAHYVLPAR